MKTIHWLLVGILAGGAAIAEEARPNQDRPQRGDRPITAAILEKFDKDGDGKLSREERSEMQRVMRERREARRKAMLERFDTDGDGRLNEAERKSAHDTILREMLAKYDANGNGELDREERRAMIEGEGYNSLAPFMRQRGPRGERGERRERGERGERRERGERGERRERGEGPGAERRERRQQGEGRPRGERRQRGGQTPAPTGDE